MNHYCIFTFFMLAGVVSTSPVMTKMSCQQKRENAFDEVSKSLLVISDALKRRQTYEIQQIPAVYKQDNCMKLDVEFKPPNLKQIAKEYNVINFMKIIFEVLDDFDLTTESLSAYELLKKQHAFNTLRIKQNYYQASLLCSKENVEKAYLHYSGNVVTILPKTCRVGGQRPPTNVANQLKHVQNVDHIIKLLDTSVKAIGEAKYNVADGKKLLGQLSGVLGALPHCYKLMAVFPNKPNKCDGVSKKFKTEKLTALSNYLKRNEFEGVSDFLLEYSKWFQARLEPSLTKLRQISNLKKIIRLRRTTKTDVNDVFLRDMLMCFDGPLTNIEVLLEDNKTPVSHSLSNVLSICSVANDWRGEVLNQVNMLNEISITIGQLLRQKIASL